ncbi:calcium-binding protein [Nocardioides lianchengensis]|uniref:Hemolysin-type calcium-binding repeat-containing protein n=1 Tax=Nocardioides lianchengensis TaxID=1045774 RepID=A0A1G7A710_9ACTN|nr:calcium-binding protein [Nocardioides lianchengensis]NYG13695.1 hypothetical protein [Nocardioides lianchengensis]SDE10463.1 Hemolysin-type calcium-binding repeat-containing protein [Nocardioides lianchengensis]
MRAHHLRTIVVRGTTLTTALLTALTGSLLVVVLTPAPAHAVVRTSTGVVCTIVGTQGRDVLQGTRGRDVICGRGGNDVIDGRGGNDLLDGGAGNDRLAGAGGDDVLVGGTGRDRLDGATGNDRALGGPGDDRIEGGSGNDRLDGGGGSDDATGDRGDDVVDGAAGNDDLAGGAGDDRLTGGPGADTGAGETGDDVILGNVGDDELSGGLGQDAVDGGAGFNVCDVPSESSDRQVRCATDTAKPVVRAISLSRTTVDVSAQAQTIRVRARITDDTGVKRVDIGGGASLASGTTRDGIWVGTIQVPRFVNPGPRDLGIGVLDRVGRTGSAYRSSAYTIVNTVYDRQRPVLQSLQLSAASVDVRAAARSITATVRVTDDLAGPTDLYVCPSHAWPTGTPSFRQDGACTLLSQVSGSARNSVWRGTFDIPRGAQGGTWNAAVWIGDAAGNFDTDYWLGPDELAAQDVVDEPRYRAIPGGGGVFRVVGSNPDTHAPVLTSLRLSPSPVDTSRGAVQVTAEIAGTDVEGITDAFLYVGGTPTQSTGMPGLEEIDIALVQGFIRVGGTAKNGTWRATFVVPGGTPDGRYRIQVGLQDRAHFESWVSPDPDWAGEAHLLDDTLASTGAYFVVANSE